MNCSKVDVDASALSLSQDNQRSHEEHAHHGASVVHKVRAVLKAVTRDGRLHVRPLCTMMDVTLALQELFELRNFYKGYVLFPQSLRCPLVKETSGVMRYVYSRYKPAEFYYMRCVYSFIGPLLESK
jgi:hypothetical protein